MADLLLTNARVLDPVRGEIGTDRHVRIGDGIIREVATQRPRADGVEVLDLRGQVLMPGLCDAHVHVTAATPDFALLRRWSPFYVAARTGEILRGMLMRGFTTVRDAGGADYGLARAVQEGYFTGPRVLFCGHAISQTGGHGDMRGPGDGGVEDCFCGAGLGRVVDGVDAVRQACRDEIRKGATHLKVMVSGGVASPTDRITNTQFSLEEIRAAVEEATAAGIPVMAHAYTSRAVDRAVQCGVRSIEHGNLIDESSIALLRQHGVFLVPTLSIVHAIAREGIEAGMPRDLHAKIFDVLNTGTRALEMAHKAGVKIAYGTDLLGSMHRHQLDEFAIRSEVQAPLDLIRSATVHAAELFQMEGEIGVVQPGARADLLVLDGDPLEDLGVLQAPGKYLKAIMKDGVLYKNELA